MKIVVFGNSGSGKSTHAKALSARHGLAHLDLDTIVWEPGQIAVPRPAEAVAASLQAFMDSEPRWVIEGCYGELVAMAAKHSSSLVFLNPGRELCLANNQRRPWEPHKYESMAAQQSMLEALQAWVSSYYTRDDPWSYAAHRRLFDAHEGAKTEHVSALGPDALDWAGA